MNESADAGQVHDEDRIHQPVLHTPWETPARHWSDTGDKTAHDGRRAPTPNTARAPRARQRALPGTDDAGDTLVARLRRAVARWRADRYPGAGARTRALLEHWSETDHEGRLFFAQREALETLFWLGETTEADDDARTALADLARDWSRDLLRMAVHMATGTGKTRVMAGLIAWHACARRRRDAQRAAPGAGADRIIVLCPNRTIASALQALDPRHPQAPYAALVPRRLQHHLRGIRVHVLNYQKLMPKPHVAFQHVAGADRKSIGLATAGRPPRPETLHQMWNRVLNHHDARARRVVVLNDEGHHCWDRNEETEDPQRTDTGVWIQALHALQDHPTLELDHVVDLSATPIFLNPRRALRPTGAPPTERFPWTVSEFGRHDAEESGLIKIAQLPRQTDLKGFAAKALRNLYEANDKRPLKDAGAMRLVRQALKVLYASYARKFERRTQARAPAPVLIVVCGTQVDAQAVFDLVSGAHEPRASHPFALFRNERTGNEADAARSILVLSGSKGDEAGDGPIEGRLGLSRVGKSAEDQARMHRWLRSVAAPGGAGESVRCVVSVSMLTEGWDCPRVTHLLGYRAFGSELLCEQTAGRALRRSDYDATQGVRDPRTGAVTQRYAAQYAVVLGVPFENLEHGDGESETGEETRVTEVHPVGKDRRIEVADFAHYHAHWPQWEARFNPRHLRPVAPGAVSRARQRALDDSLEAESDLQIGERAALATTPERESTGAWRLAARLTALSRDWIEREREAPSPGTVHLFESCLRVAQAWADLTEDRRGPVDLALLSDENLADVCARHVFDAVCLRETRGALEGVPRARARATRAASDWRPFTTTLPHVAEAQRSELNCAACHSKLEADVAARLDRLPGVEVWTRNHGPEAVHIPYFHLGTQRDYIPDFWVRLANGDGPPVQVVLECKGPRDDADDSKAWWTRHWWVPCANRAQAPVRWAHAEIGATRELDAALRAARTFALTGKGRPTRRQRT